MRLSQPAVWLAIVGACAVPGISTGSRTNTTALDTYLSENLTEMLQEKVGSIRVTVQTTNTLPTRSPRPEGSGSRSTVTNRFCYTHGLPDSTSYGCQNIAHGHASSITLTSEDSDYSCELGLWGALDRITAFLDNCYIAANSSLASLNPDLKSGGLTNFSYQTGRGQFELRLTGSPVWVIPDAPTVENILKHVVMLFAKDLDTARATSISISEGLWKGAFALRPERGWESA